MPSQILVLVFMSNPTTVRDLSRTHGPQRDCVGGAWDAYNLAGRRSSNVLVLNHSSDNHGRGARMPDGGRCVFDGRSHRGTVMQIVIGNVLSSKELGLVRAALARARFVDGAATAGFAARPVKNNRQAEGSDRSLGTIRKLVAERVLGNEVFRLAVRPKALSPLLFSRYEKGMRYGSHVDDALMDGMRTDVSFTLFLSEPESYDGGELAIEGVSGEETFKLDAGALVAYSATSLHHVTEVTRGARLAAVGWVRSFVRDPARRELLFDLDTARRQMFAREGKSSEFDLVSKSLANLLRMWVED
jgi:PKHD-type hydroxylase